MQRILVIQLARIGDLLQSSPLIQGIRGKNGDVEVTLLISEKTKELASRISGVDEVLGFDFEKASRIINDGQKALSSKYQEFSSLLNGLKGRSFDSVYNLNYSPVNANLMNLIDYRKAFCYPLDKSNRRILKNPWLSYMFSILRDRRLNRFNLVDIYLHGAEIPCSERSLSFQVGGGAQVAAARFLARHGIGEGDRLIGFQLGAGDTIRCWPVESYARLADRLIQLPQVRIVLFGSPTETELGREFEARLEGFKEEGAGKGRIINLVGKTTLQELGAFLTHCELLLTPDTGTMHLAAAVGTRVMALFLGSAFCHETGPYGNGHLVIHPRLACYPCLQNQHPCSEHHCKEAISADTVAEIIERVGWDHPNEIAGAPGLELDSEVAVLRSRMADGLVEYIPVAEYTFSLEDTIAQGYRVMWQWLLNGTRSAPTVETGAILGHCDVASLTQAQRLEIRTLEMHFEKLQKLLKAAQASFRPQDTASVELTLGREQALRILKGKGKTGPRWIRPLIHFFDVEYENIRSSDGGDMQIERLLGRLARGAQLMKDFSRGLAGSVLA